MSPGRPPLTRLARLLARLLALGTLALAPAWAGTVYRWVDEQGRVNYGEQVPERYRPQARPLDAPATAPSAQEQQQAAERAGRDKARAAALTAPTAASAASAAAPGASSTASAPAKRPARLPDASTDCATWQRLYQESLDCFGAYRTVRGGLRPEAFAHCNEVQEPPPTRCRMRMP